MALRPRQVHFYQDVCSIYRKNKTRATNGKTTYSLLASGVVCKHFTRPNYDNAAAAEGVTLTKEDNLFTDDILHLDPTQDIASGDYVKFTSGPTFASKMTTFKVVGEPETRLGIANRSSVYLMPDPLPAGSIV